MQQSTETADQSYGKPGLSVQAELASGLTREEQSMTRIYDGEFSRRVKQMTEIVSAEREETRIAAARTKLAQNIAFGDLRKSIAVRHAARPEEFEAALEVLANEDGVKLLLHGGGRSCAACELTQREGGSWCLDSFTGCWNPQTMALDDWCIAVLSGQIEEEEVPF